MRNIWRFSLVVYVVGHINEVSQHWSRLVHGSVTVNKCVNHLRILSM